MVRHVACGALVATCTLVTESGTTYPPSYAIAVEPDTVRVLVNTQRRSQLDIHTRVANHGPGSLFIPDCGHEMQRAEPNGSWVRVHAVPCQTRGPPNAVDVGATFNYVIRISAPPDSSPWQRGHMAGRYRTVTYISTQCRAGSAWGQPLAFDRRISPEFVVREVP